MVYENGKRFLINCWNDIESRWLRARWETNTTNIYIYNILTLLRTTQKESNY